MAKTASWPKRLANSAHVVALGRVERSVPFWPIARIEWLQRRRLRSIVRHAYGTVPFYRETMDRLGITPHDLQSVADLAKLPLVEREHLQRDPEAFFSTAYVRARTVELRSGGSTGQPRAVFHDTVAILQGAAHLERDRAVIRPLLASGVGYREAILAPPFSSAYEVLQARRAHIVRPRRTWIERQYLSLLDSPAAIARQIEAFKPDVLHAYGSALESLFALYAANGGTFHKPRVITYSADALSETTRRSIEEEFGIPVFAKYQAVEATPIGFECDRRQGYHLNVDLFPPRIVDAVGRTLPAGESGEVVVSNLVNRATVLLNYRLGDLGTLATEPCPCGRSLPLLATLDGRSDDVIILPSGRNVHPQALRTVFTGEERVWQYQIVQEAPNRFDVAVVAAPDVDRAGLRARVLAGLAARLVDPVTIEVTFVDAIARTAGGKVRPIISRCPSGVTNPGDGGAGDG